MVYNEFVCIFVFWRWKMDLFSFRWFADDPNVHIRPESHFSEGCVVSSGPRTIPSSATDLKFNLNSFQIISFSNQIHFFSTSNYLLWLLLDQWDEFKSCKIFLQKFISFKIFPDVRQLWPHFANEPNLGAADQGGSLHYVCVVQIKKRYTPY